MNIDTAFYVPARIARRFFPWSCIPASLRQRLPGFRPNAGEGDQDGVSRIYQNNIPTPSESWLDGKHILEIGTGRTNGCCYVLAARGAARAVSFEPFRQLDTARNLEQKLAVCERFSTSVELLDQKVSRQETVDTLPDSSFDTVLSLAVLEHVTDMKRLADDLWRLLKPGGIMFHAVDYRDHFFRYPYHHLLWSERTWQSYLNPGDLPRWRIGDHVAIFNATGFETEILKAHSIDSEFEKVESRIHPTLRVRYSDHDLKTAYGMILATKPSN